MVKWQHIVWAFSLLALDFVVGLDDPLIVTPLLEAGKIEHAQEKALLTPEFGGVKSYSGFFNVNKVCGNNLFFWFFPAEKNQETAPVLLWLNRFSRQSVLYEVFLDVGLFNYSRVSGFTKRKYPWTKEHNVLFLDHPVGNGFSFTEKGCYPDSMDKVYNDVYNAIVQFFQLFPSLGKNPFFIVGQNFAGKYAPGIALEVDKGNKNSSEKVNLVGIILGDSYFDTRCHFTSEFQYQLGIYDKKTKAIFSDYSKNIDDAVDRKDYTGAYDVADKFPNIAVDLPSLRNILYDSENNDYFQTYVRHFQIRSQIHVGRSPFKNLDTTLLKSLRPTIFEPVNSKIEEFLNTGKYTLVLYGGQLDLQNPYTSIACVLEGLKWPGLKDYLAANRSAWYVGERLAGWVKVAGNVAEVAVRNSGMYTTRDQPLATYTLLLASLRDRPGKELLTSLKYEPED